jgi:hypothetical protein
MRIWTVHPRYLDVKGFVALWRETLLGMETLKKHVKCQHYIPWYKHPQLAPFKAQSDPILYISNYLYLVLEESRRRNYNFDGSKLDAIPYCENLPLIKASREVLVHEWLVCLGRYRVRSPKWFEEVKDISPLEVDPHPLYICEPEEA